MKGRRVRIGQRWIRRFSCSPHRLHPNYLAHQVAPRDSTLSSHSQQGKVCSSPPSPGSVQPTLSIPEDAACTRAPSASHLTRLRHRRPSSRRNLAFCGSLRDCSPRLISSSTYLRSIGFYKQRVPSDERQLIGKVVILLADLGAKSHAHSHRTRKNFMRPCNLGMPRLYAHRKTAAVTSILEQICPHQSQKIARNGSTKLSFRVYWVSEKENKGSVMVVQNIAQQNHAPRSQTT